LCWRGPRPRRHLRRPGQRRPPGQAGTHRLVIAAGPNTRPGPAQLAYWQPGDTRLRIATIQNLAEISNLQTGNIG
jgi:hypothetical protein